MKLRLKALFCLACIYRWDVAGIALGYRQWADGTSTLCDLDGVIPRPAR